MGSSRWSASLGSKKVLEDPKENNLKDNKEGAGKIVTDDNEPSSLGGDAHRSMTENLSATQNIEKRKPGSTYVPFRMTPIQENIQEKQDVDSEVLEDGKIFRDELKIKDKDTEQNEERSPETQQYSSVVTLIRNSESEENQATCGETGGADMSLSGRPSELSKNEHFEDTSKKFDVRANGFNVVMVGSSSVGKTSFMKRLQSGLFSSDFSASIGIDMCMHAVPVDGREVMLQLWDTAGQERYVCIHPDLT
ncbi:hypothetical protein NHX12_029626 [Muraenolepis orangiensis]|uniref:Uncharacterized protein n=1 Tax=Muraenolepis orangiensis TaxID=630683 RepID=A0A9Q0E6K7_9TELE|nr:hypothetical protein NHX12_029626 [Muraenolepis orangiensis]